MRSNAITAAVVTAAALVGMGSANVFADTTTATTSAKVHTAASTQNYVTVEPGDYLAKIAASNNTTYVRIYDANTQIQNPDLIYPGQQLRIPAADEELTERALPGASAPAAAPVSTPAPAAQAAAPTSDPDDDQAAQAATPAPAPVVSTPAPAPVVSTPAVGDTTTSTSSASSSQYPAVASGSVWDELAQCESSGNWAADTGNGFYGGLQFTLSSWEAVGGTGYPNQASRDEQIALAQKLQAEQGWGAWPVCSQKIGL